MSGAELSVAHRSIRVALFMAALLLLILVVGRLTLNIDRFGPSAHESEAVGSLRNIVVAQNEFRSMHGCFASDLRQLPRVTSLDDAYSYVVLPRAKDDKGCVRKYIVTASPSLSWKTRGGHYFAMDEAESLHYETAAPADEHSPALEVPAALR